MENNKKTLGILFLIFVGLLTFNTFFAMLSFWGVNIFSGTLLVCWNSLCYTFYIMCALTMAFLPACQSGTVAKTGACCLSAVWFVNLANTLSLRFLGFQAVEMVHWTLAMTTITYIAGMAMFIWGCRLWMPIKIAYTFLLMIGGMLDAFQHILWSHYGVADHKVMGLPILGTTSLVYFGVMATILLLTVIWVAKNNPATAPRETSY